MQMTWIHLSNPRTGEKKKYLPTSPMVFFFGGLFFPFITRGLWGWVVVYVLWWMVNLAVIVLTVDAPGYRGDRAFWIAGLALAAWAAFASNKQATRKLLNGGWIVSPETTPEAWAMFQKKWKLPDSARPTWPSTPGPQAKP
jgi:D-alanyl-lipoteichoic acid acyltransferase DltB (MBOAT superfamily)